MAQKAIYSVKRRRRREGSTDETKRLKLVKSGKDRLVVRISGRKIVSQLIKYSPEGDQTLVNTTSLELKKLGWSGHPGNASAAYLTGFLCGKKAVKKGIKEAILDIGLRTPVRGSNVFAVLKGAVEAGLDVTHDPKVFPADEKLMKGNAAEVKEKISKM